MVNAVLVSFACLEEVRSGSTTEDVGEGQTGKSRNTRVEEPSVPLLTHTFWDAY